jgi:hypothetical protein
LQRQSEPRESAHEFTAAVTDSMASGKPAAEESEVRAVNELVALGSDAVTYCTRAHTARATSAARHGTAQHSMACASER